jgi:chemotaxis protein CheD
VYLHAGQIFASADPYCVSTVLGSCVAVCLWDSALRMGAMNHFLLPYPCSEKEKSLRFGNVATKALVEKMMSLGSRRKDLLAKVFGGACVLDIFKKKEMHLGARNIEVALESLEKESIAVISMDVAGNRGRKLIFYTDTGRALTRNL